MAADSINVISTKGWFYFKVSGVRTGESIRFRMNGFTMNKHLFEKGMKPVWMDQDVEDNRWRPIQ